MEPLKFSLLEVLGLVLAVVATASVIFQSLIWGKPRSGKRVTPKGGKSMLWQSRNECGPGFTSR
jgi:hypothetical protein